MSETLSSITSAILNAEAKAGLDAWPSAGPNYGVQATADSLVSLVGDVGDSPSPSPWT